MKNIFKKLTSAALCIAMAITGAFGAVPACAASGSGSSQAAWDGKTIDVSWYSKSAKELHISTPAQLAGLVVIVNGIYNADITNIIGDKSVLVDNRSETGSNGPQGNNQATSQYHYGSDDFNGKTVYLDADIDMGGVYNASTGKWSGPNYMPIGGQYLMKENDSTTKLSSSFCGTFDGRGHTISNIYCSRRCSNGNFGDGQSVGMIGRLGVHDSDAASLRPLNPAVRNVTVTGYVYANRSVGGVVGKIGKTDMTSNDSTGGIIENCANFATVENTDAKGVGGIVGSAWNGGIIRNCYNAGNISTTYACPTGGIAGSNEIAIENCYNIGAINAKNASYALAIGTNNGGAPYGTVVKNCYYLEGSALGGGYYSNGNSNDDGAMSAAEMKSAAFLSKLGSAFVADTYGMNNGYPILKTQAENAAKNNANNGSNNNNNNNNAPAPAGKWSDVAAGSWYEAYVDYVTENGLFDSYGKASGGSDNNIFAPAQPMTRHMLVTALYRMAGSPQVNGASAFTDVSASASYASAVIWADQNGIVNGVSATSFDPNGNITRQQIATMFMRYASYAKADTSVTADLASFKDAGAVADYAAAGMKWCVGAGLITGTSAAALSPNGTATRAQVAAMVQRFAEFVEK